MPWLTWFLLSPLPHPYRHMVMVFESVLGRARGAPGISSILSGVSPLPRCSSGSSSNPPPCFQEPRNVNLLVPEPCNSQSPSCRPPGCGEQSIAKVLCCVAAVLLEMWEGREWQGHQPSPLSGNGRLWLWRDLEGTRCLFPSLPSLPAPSNILLFTRAFPKSLEIRETSCQSLLPMSPCSLHPDGREGQQDTWVSSHLQSQTQGRPVPMCQLVSYPPLPLFSRLSVPLAFCVPRTSLVRKPVLLEPQGSLSTHIPDVLESSLSGP